MNDITIIDTIVKYSKDCIIMRFVSNHLQKSLFLISRLPFSCRLPSGDTIKIIIDELAIRLNEKENDIGRLLIPLFEGKDFGHTKSNKHSLTLSEIKDGYILLDKEEYVILLKPLKSLYSDLHYSPGVLYKINDGILKKDLDDMKRSDAAIITNDLLNLIIKKKTAYEYLE